MTDLIPHINQDRRPTCGYCGEPLNIKHILIECLKYENERRELQTYFLQNNMHMSTFRLLQDDEVVIGMLIRYLHSTNLISEI